MKARPFRVLKLIREKRSARVAGHSIKRIDEAIRANDPKHIEATQGIHGHEPLPDSGTRFRDALGGYGSGSQRHKGSRKQISLRVIRGSRLLLGRLPVLAQVEANKRIFIAGEKQSVG